MAALEFQRNTLGEKHRHYNELVKQKIKNNEKIQVEDFNTVDSDVNNLIKIDVACKQRNVECVLKILQCEDMLYVSRAIKRSTWLITDRQYSHIINPNYLHTQLFPKMMSKACAKLLLQIRIHLKDEKHIDNFYNYIKEKNIEAAFRWLPYCSLPLAVQEVQKYRVELNYSNKRHIFKRLCEKSIQFLEICIKGHDYPSSVLQATMFLLNTNTKKYLDIVESYDSPYRTPSFGPKATHLLMKTYPQRILNKFEIYCNSDCKNNLDLATFARHFKPEEIKDFIHKLSCSKNMQSWLKYENLKNFIKQLPSEDQFDYIMKFLIQKSKKEDEEDMKSDDESSRSQQCSMKCSDNILLRSSANIYRWYNFAPFNVAFANLCKSSPSERIAMFGVLLSSAKGNPKDIETIVEYYKERHINEPFKFKIQFVNMLLTKTDTYRFNETAWNNLNNLFHSMEVYDESINDVQSCIEAIILYKILHNENVPQIIKKKFKFQSMKSIKTKITDVEKETVFEFLFKFLVEKMKMDNISSETELSETVRILEDVHILLKDWNKDLAAYPWLLENIKNLIEIRNTNHWRTNLSTLFIKNKTWRRILFQKSLLLSPSEETCYNILKHEPGILKTNKSAVEELRRDDNVSLRRVLRTLRVYWPQSLAAEWMIWYLNSLETPSAPKSLIRGLCMLAPRLQLIDVIKKYAPTDSKINWSEDNELVLNIRKHLARNMHVSRPLLSPEIVLLYAKGDYLHFALPSIDAVFHNASAAQTREHVSKLLDAPVSLQKHGIQFAFTKLESGELKSVFHNIWQNAKNPSIRVVLFKQTYNLLCRQRNLTMIQEIWELLSIFIDNLSIDENKKIYYILTRDYKEIPMLARGKFFMKSFMFLKSLPAQKLIGCENNVDDLLEKMTDLIENLDPDFIKDVLLESEDKIFTTDCIRHSELMAAYLLCSNDAEIQSERYRKVFLPVLERAFLSWDKCYVAAHVEEFLKQLTMYFQKFAFEKRMVFPTKLFADIHLELVNKLPAEKHYELQNTWKLLATYVSLLEDQKDTLDTIQIDYAEIDEEMKKKSDYYYFFNPKTEKQWNKIYLKALPEFAKICLTYLQEDIDNYFPSIYCMFASSLENAFTNINTVVYLECLESLLVDEGFIPSYMVVLHNTPLVFYGDDYDESYGKIINRICEKLFSNPSPEIKFNYLRKFTRHDVS